MRTPTRLRFASRLWTLVRFARAQPRARRAHASRLSTQVRALRPCVILYLLACGLRLSPAHAQAAHVQAEALHETEAPFAIPPAPSKAQPRFAVEIHGIFSGPLDNRSLCPTGVGCVLQGGGGLGGSFERRWPTGMGAFLAYDAWFLDSDSVYELGVQQALHGGFRYTMPTDTVFHPLFDLSAGVMAYGDTFQIATVGGLAEIFAGAEIELTETFGLRVGFGLRVFSHRRFRTERDQIVRGNQGFFAESLFVQIGLTVM